MTAADVALLAEDHPDTQVMVWNADNNARREIYWIHLTKSHTLRLPDIFTTGEHVDNPHTTVHLGIVRNTNWRADIDGKYFLGGRPLIP